MRIFSKKIKTDEEFLTACKDIAKSVFGDAYDEELTNKTASGILKDHSDMSYNQMIGFYRNGIKGFSDTKPRTKDGLTPKQVVSNNRDQCDKMVKRYYREYKSNNEGFVLKTLDECYDECKRDFIRIDSKNNRWKDLLLELASRMVAIEMLNSKVGEPKGFSEREKVDAATLKNAKETSVIQKKPNGAWGIISIDKGEWWTPDYESEEKAKNALKAYQANKKFSSESRSFMKNEKYAVVIQNPDKTYEVVSIQDKDDEDRLKSYQKEGCKVIKTCKSTYEADKYIESNKLTRAYSELEIVGSGKKPKTKVTKGFSSLPIDNDPSVITENQRDLASRHGMPKFEIPQVTADWSLNKPFNISIEPWLIANVTNDKADGLYLGQMLGDAIEMGKDELKLDIKLGDSQPRKVFVLVKSGKAIIFRLDQLCKSETKTYAIGDAVEYSFDITPCEIAYDMQHLIGSWMLAASVAHLFHICDTKYAGHVALNEFYESSPEKIDALAEHFLAENPKACFKVCITPKGCPIQYLEDLVSYTKQFEQLAHNIPSAYQSQIDDLINLTQSTLYKLKRLDSGRRIFSISQEECFSEADIRYIILGWSSRDRKKEMNGSPEMGFNNGGNKYTKEQAEKEVERLKKQYPKAIFSIRKSHTPKR